MIQEWVRRGKSLKTKTRLFKVRGNCYLVRGLTNPNNLIERLEIFLLETKGGHHCLYDENISTFKSCYLKNLLVKSN